MFESWKHVEPFTNEEVNAGSWCMCIYVCVCVLEWVVPFLHRHCPRKRYISRISHIPFIAVAAGPLRMGLDEGGDLLQVPFVRSAEPKLEIPTIGDSHWNLDVAREVPFESYPCAWWSMFGYAVWHGSIHVNTKQLRWILDCYSGSNMTMTIIILARPLGCWPFLKRKSRKMNLNPSW